MGAAVVRASCAQLQMRGLRQTVVPAVSTACTTAAIVATTGYMSELDYCLCCQGQFILAVQFLIDLKFCTSSTSGSFPRCYLILAFFHFRISSDL